MAFCVPWTLTVEINIPHDAFIITGHFVFENNLANACTSATIFPKTDTVALALWASIYWMSQFPVLGVSGMLFFYFYFILN